MLFPSSWVRLHFIFFSFISLSFMGIIFISIIPSFKKPYRSRVVYLHFVASLACRLFITIHFFFLFVLKAAFCYTYSFFFVCPIIFLPTLKYTIFPPLLLLLFSSFHSYIYNGVFVSSYFFPLSFFPLFFSPLRHYRFLRTPFL